MNLGKKVKFWSSIPPVSCTHVILGGLLITYATLCACFPEAAARELEKEPAYWDAQARATLGAALKLRPRDHQARNIILFLGDGRSQRKSRQINALPHLTALISIAVAFWEGGGSNEDFLRLDMQVPIIHAGA